ncbi:MAG: Holliday junction branch migration protein RuvA [Bacteroidales bacterium]
MYDYISGKIEELGPAELILDNNSIGYKIEISLNSYTRFQGLKEAKVYIYHHIKEDDEVLYGFFEKKERIIFTQLISVSGIGPNTARMMLSSLTANEVEEAIASNDVTKIKSVKGIGAKTAQRCILELKDKISKGTTIYEIKANTNIDEARSALILLGFNKNAVEKILQKVIKQDENMALEELIKKSLKLL